MTAALRDRIAAAIDRLRESGAVYALEDHERDRIADAVLPLVAAEREAGRRDGLRDGANDLAAVANPHTERGAGVRWAADRLRARADAAHATEEPRP